MKTLIGSNNINRKKNRNFLQGVADLDFSSAALVFDPNSDIDLDVARAMVTDFTDTWEDLKSHLTNLGGITPPPALPRLGQNVAFRIDVDNMNGILGGATNVGCLFCFNFRGIGLNDNTFSLLFVGIDAADAPKSRSAIEKWPGIYVNNDVTGAPLTVMDSANQVKTNLLPASITGASHAKTLVDAFAVKWTDLLNDTSGTILATRPTINHESHALMYRIDADKIRKMLQPPSQISYIIGVMGFDSTNGNIVPFFIPVNKSGAPVGEICFVDSIAYTVEQIKKVRQNVLISH